MIGEEIIGIIGRTGTVFQHRSGPSNDLDWRSSVPAEKLPDSPAFSQPPDVRLIPLTQGKFAIVDAADYEWLMQWKWFAHHNTGKWYAHRNATADGKKQIVLMHRAIMCAAPGIFVDHVDDDGLNNSRLNLRFADKQKNSCNRKQPKSNRSGFKGVFWDKNSRKWQAQICAHGKRIYLGTFHDKTDAALAYDRAAAKHHGEFAYLNFRMKPNAL